MRAAARVDVSSLRTAASGECVDTSPSSAVRCTISVLRKELGRVVLRAHVVNDTEEPVRCSPGTKRDANAVLRADLDLVCEPHAELGFLFAVPRYGRARRAAFVRVAGTTFACGFDAPLEDEAARAAAISLAFAAALVAVVAGVVVYERRKRRAPPPLPPKKVEIVEAEIVEPAPIVPVAPNPVVVQPVRDVEARGFAAVLDEQRVVMGALECTQVRAFSTDFVAKVVNQAREPLLCTIAGRTRRATVPIEAGAFWIHPQSAAAVAVSAPLRFPWRVRTLDLSMENSGLRASAQADVPAPIAVRAGVAAAVLVVAITLGAVAIRTVAPAIRAFAMPVRVLAGDTVTANYVVSGIGAVRYVVTHDGTRVASGAVRAGRGAFAFAALRPGAYRVELRARGPFGSAQTVRVVAALAQMPAASASVSALEVEPGVAAAGAPITVRYVARAQSGSVALVDAADIALQTVPYRSSGTSVLIAPRVVEPTQYQVLLQIARGGSTARASVGMLVIPQTLAEPSPPATVPPMIAALELLRVVPAHVIGAHRFSVVVLEHPANLQLTLQDATGGVVARRAIAPNAAAVEFLAPRVAATRRYVIVASFTRGSADQLVLQPLVVYAR